MSSNDIIAVTIIVVGVFIVSLFAITTQSDNEMAKAGLQQCVVKAGISTHVVWQKECEKLNKQ
jgi:hypothetical protein